MIETLKIVWDEDPERCYGLYRVVRKTIRIRRVFGGRLMAEIFSTALRWEPLTMPTVRMPKHTEEHFNQMAMTILNEVVLILGGDRMDEN